MKNIDITEWLLSNNIDPLKEIIAGEKQCFLSDVSKRYLVKFVDSFWFEHETEVNAIDEDEAIEKTQKQFKNASHFQVSQL